jgi:hypothetical protein
MSLRNTRGGSEAEIREIMNEKAGKIPVYAAMIFGAFVLAMLL